jgi:hypothetical protein
VQDLSGQVPGLVPSSMEGGNMVATNEIAMALPGSTPITPMPEAPNLLDQNLPLPKLGAQVPVGTERDRVHGARQPAGEPADPPGRFGGVTVGTGTDKPGGGWKLTPSAGGGTA